MNLPGVADPAYVEARRLLLNVLEKLGRGRSQVVLVGAQAVHMNVEPDVLPVVAYTIDGDLAVDPRDVPDDPALAPAMRDAGLERVGQPGIWTQPEATGPIRPSVDLLVPAIFSPRLGKRGADLPGQEENVARYVSGIEPAVVDYSVQTIRALEDGDERKFSLRVAGPAALVIAKVYKLRDRLADSRHPERVEPKDGYEVYRLLQLPTNVLRDGWSRALGDEVSSEAAREAIPVLREQFGTLDSPGVQLAGRYVAEFTDRGTVLASSSALAVDLLVELEKL